MYLGPLRYGYALNCHLVYLSISKTRSLCMKKGKFVCFIYMQPQKVNFSCVQVNMKQVSYRNSVEFFVRFRYCAVSLTESQYSRKGRMKEM